MDPDAAPPNRPSGGPAPADGERGEALRESEVRHRLLIGSLAQALWETDPDGVVVADSPTWRAYTEQRLDEWLGYGWLDAIHPDDRGHAERQWRETVAAGGLVNAEFRLRAPDGGWRWTNVRAAPIRDEDGRILKWAGMNVDIDAAKRAEAALRESEARYQALFAGSPVPFMVLDANPPDYTITAANDAYFAATLTTPATLIGRRLFDVFPDDPSRPGQLGSEALGISLDRVLRFKRTDAMARVRYDLVTPHGFEPHWWLATNAPMLDAAGDVTAILHQVYRQTELHGAEQAQREGEERARLLVAELQHRTRNLLTVVGGIADQTRATSDNLADFGQRFDRRLAALGRVQGLLSTGPLPSIDLGELVALELDAHGIDPAGAATVTLAGPEVALPAPTVQLLALALHELTTNALKHGALWRQGRLAIAWAVRDAADGSRLLALTWAERGVPGAGAPTRRGFGRELIEVDLPYELDATTRLHFGEDGVTCLIEVALPPER